MYPRDQKSKICKADISELQMIRLYCSSRNAAGRERPAALVLTQCCRLNAADSVLVRRFAVRGDVQTFTLGFLIHAQANRVFHQRECDQ